MRVICIDGDKEVSNCVDVTRAEATHVTAGDEQYRVFMLDAEDSLDLVVHYPSGEREIVWSLAK